MKKIIWMMPVLAVIMIFAGCSSGQGEIGLSPEASCVVSGVDIALADMDGDDDLDIVIATTNGVKYFENLGEKNFVDRGIIIENRVPAIISGVGVDIDDIDGDGDLDIVVATTRSLNIFENPVPQK